MEVLATCANNKVEKTSKRKVTWAGHSPASEGTKYLGLVYGLRRGQVRRLEGSWVVVPVRLTFSDHFQKKLLLLATVTDNMHCS